MQATTGTLLTMKEAAEIIRVSSRHLHNLRTKGLLPVVKLGGSIRVRPADLERMAEKLLVGGGK